MHRWQVLVSGWVLFGVVWLVQAVLEGDAIQLILALGAFGLAGYALSTERP